MNLLIRHKLFLVILLANIIVAIAIFTSIGWNFSRGFREYVKEDMIERLDPLAEALASEYVEQGESWRWLNQDMVAWQKFLIDYGAMTITRRYVDKKEVEKNKELVDRKSLQKALRNPELTKPERRRLRKELNQRIVLERQLHARGHLRGRKPPNLYVRDGEGNLLIGKNDQRLKHYVWTPIKRDNEIIGELGFAQDPRFNRELDRLFVRRVLNQSATIILIIVLISACLAVPISRRFVKPVTQLKSAMKSLSSGDIREAEHLKVKGGDELAQLALSFNLLADTLNSNLNARQQWVADISHELRTPVAVLRGELEALVEGIRPFDQDAVASLHEEVIRLARLIDDLYQLSLSDLGALNYRRSEIDLNSLLNELIVHAKPELDKHSLNLDLESNLVDALVYGDHDRLMQLFRNLLTNTIRYTHDGGQIKVNISRDEQMDNSILITWDDSEPGVADEDLGHLFERLYRGDQARDRDSGGSGLGLAICRSIVEAHQGQIEAAHSELGGLKVELRLPLHQIDASI